jgi:hypothetical protein
MIEKAISRFLYRQRGHPIGIHRGTAKKSVLAHKAHRA